MTTWAITVPKTFSWDTWLKEMAQLDAGTHVKNFKVGPHSKAKAGDRVFVVYDGRVRGSLDVCHMRAQFSFQCDATGQEFSPGTYIALRGPWMPQEGPEMKGFQGIRRYQAQASASASCAIRETQTPEDLDVKRA